MEFSAETPADAIHRLNTQILLLEKDIEWIKKLEFWVFSILITLVIAQALAYQNLRKKRRRGKAKAKNYGIIKPELLSELL